MESTQSKEKRDECAAVLIFQEYVTVFWTKANETVKLFDKYVKA